MSKTLILPKAIFALIAFFLILALSYPVWAKDPPAGKQNAASPAAKKAEIKQKIETKMETIQEKLEAKKAQIATREAALKAKLESFKDQKKATIAARVSENLNKINDKQTEQMLKHLDKMTSILDKLEARVDQGRPDIKDPAKARLAIASASATVASASAAVNDQSAKDYTLQVSSEGKVKDDAKTARNRLFTDLKKVRQMVIDAKQAVAAAIRAAKEGASGK